MTDELHGETEQFWEGHYRGQGRVWSGRANPVLVDVAGSLRPRTALDLGCGEGGDAVWLAQQGWRVTAVDVSATALDRAATLAAEAGVDASIDFQQHDLARTFPEGAFDLVSAQYLHSPAAVVDPRRPQRQPPADRRPRLGRTLVVEPQTASPLPHSGGNLGRARPESLAVAHRTTGHARTSGHRPERGVCHRHRQRRRGQAPRESLTRLECERTHPCSPFVG